MSNVLLGSLPLESQNTSWPARHPDDSSEAVFMGRAIRELARAKFGDTWTGEEPNTQLPELLPDVLAPSLFNALAGPDAANNSDEPAQWFDPPSRSVLERADRLLAVHRPDLGRPGRLIGMFGGLGRAIHFTIREWKLAQEFARREREECLEALIRWLNLQKEVVALCESGVLESMLRPVEGGEFSPVLPRHHWRTELYAARFLIFAMNPQKPFVGSRNPQELEWIFFTSASLRRAVAKLHAANGKPESEDASIYKSEAQRHIEKVSASLKISESNRMNKESVKQTVIDLWTGPGELSDTEAGYMATFIRPREHKLGKRPRE